MLMLMFLESTIMHVYIIPMSNQDNLFDTEHVPAEADNGPVRRGPRPPAGLANINWLEKNAFFI